MQSAAHRVHIVICSAAGSPAKTPNRTRAGRAHLRAGSIVVSMDRERVVVRMTNDPRLHSSLVENAVPELSHPGRYRTTDDRDQYRASSQHKRRARYRLNSPGLGRRSGAELEAKEPCAEYTATGRHALALDLGNDGSPHSRGGFGARRANLRQRFRPQGLRWPCALSKNVHFRQSYSGRNLDHELSPSV